MTVFWSFPDLWCVKAAYFIASFVAKRKEVIKA